jgi:hypothetical protein
MVIAQPCPPPAKQCVRQMRAPFTLNEKLEVVAFGPPQASSPSGSN